LVRFPTLLFHLSARPLGFIAIVDILKQEVIELEELPIQADFGRYDRDGDSLHPLEDGNYDPTVSPNRLYRSDISPITIQQDGGPSYTVQGNILQWQKFKMRVG
jgi:primary-amine oxidase